MKAAIFVNELSLGGTEKAACEWGRLLKEREHEIFFLALKSGPRISDLERSNIPYTIISESSTQAKILIADIIAPMDVIHIHAPGFPHPGDVLGNAIQYLGRKIPVVQTNIFGKLQNPAENAWTDFRLYISWTSCVQAARRSGRRLDHEFFRRQSVAVYPLEDPLEDQAKREILELGSGRLRESLGRAPEHVLFGRFSRPEPNKWTPLVLEAFLAAYRENPNLRLLLREPPPEVAHHLQNSGLAQLYPATDRMKAQLPNIQRTIYHSQSATICPILILPATADPTELTTSQMACDVILHTSSIGESFGYGLAEPMALGKPVITNSVPWHDQAQIELVRHGECGLIASTPPSMKKAILHMAGEEARRIACGRTARQHILKTACPTIATDRVEMALQCACSDADNPMAEQDLEVARRTAEYLDKHQWGHDIREMLQLHTQNAKIRFQNSQRRLRDSLKRLS